MEPNQENIGVNCGCLSCAAADRKSAFVRVTPSMTLFSPDKVLAVLEFLSVAFQPRLLLTVGPRDIAILQETIRH